MKQFALGVIATLATMLAAVLVLVLLVGSGATPVPAETTSPGATVVAPPSDLEDDQTWLATVALRGEQLVAPDGTLRDLDARGVGIRFGPEGLHADRLDIDATLPFDTVAEQVGGGIRLYAAGGGLAGIQRTADILGREITIRATGQVRADNGLLIIEPESVDIGAPSWINSAVSATARALVTLREEVPGVPNGMRLTQVSVNGAGFAVSLTGADVSLGAPPAP